MKFEIICYAVKKYIVDEKYDGVYLQDHNYLHSHYLRTAMEGNVFTGVCHSVYNWPHAYSVTAHPCNDVVG